jgi:hypothetical protein
MRRWNVRCGRIFYIATSRALAAARCLTRVQGLPRTTEAERLVVQRIGQNIFRAHLMDYWQNRCPLTGIADPDLLRASHIIPWSECEAMPSGSTCVKHGEIEAIYVRRGRRKASASSSIAPNPTSSTKPHKQGCSMKQDLKSPGYPRLAPSSPAS